MTKRVLISKRQIPLAEKLEMYSERVPFSGCAIWTRTTNGTIPEGCGGYGVVSLNDNGKRQYAHRIAYELAFGPIPQGMMVLHRCDVKSCVNPNHLFLGTAKDNSDDRDRKGRGRFPDMMGEKNRHAKLTVNDILSIRKEHDEEGATSKEIAEKYKISVGYVKSIWMRKYWKHLP